MKHKEFGKNETDPPQIDDNWWEAVMADEEKYARGEPRSAHTDHKPRPRPSKKGCEDDWEQVRHLLEKDIPVKCQVVGFNRGGLLVEGDVFHGFVPISHLIEIEPAQMQSERESCLEAYMGRNMRLKVIECDPQRGRVVLSERAALTAPGERQRLLESLGCGDKVEGCVTNITDFGVFIDLGGVEGLVHISELSWGRVTHPEEVVAPGEKVRVQILQIDSERGRVALSVKRLLPNPWTTAAERYQRGDLIDATITDIVPFGAFARLEEGLEGLIHVSQMGGEERVDPWEVVHEGQKVMARVLHVDPSRQRMSLSLVNENEARPESSSTSPEPPPEPHG